MKTSKLEILAGTNALAREIGISRAHLWLVRTGRQKPSRRVREALKAAGVSIRRPPKRKGGAE